MIPLNFVVFVVINNRNKMKCLHIHICALTGAVKLKTKNKQKSSTAKYKPHKNVQLYSIYMHACTRVYIGLTSMHVDMQICNR